MCAGEAHGRQSGHGNRETAPAHRPIFGLKPPICNLFLLSEGRRPSDSPHALSRAAPPARSVRVARSRGSLAPVLCSTSLGRRPSDSPTG